MEGMSSGIHLLTLRKPFKVFRLRQREEGLCFCANAFDIH